MKKIELFFGVCSAVLFLCGCGEIQRLEKPKPVCVLGLSKSEAMAAAEEVLGQMHFVVAKADVQRGILQTRPLPGAQFFEFWRDDVSGDYQTTESNIHTTRRTVELTMFEQGQKVCIACDVKVERLSISEFDIEERRSGEHGFEKFSDRRSSSKANLELKSLGGSNKEWISLGGDSRLERLILRRLEARIGNH